MNQCFCFYLIDVWYFVSTSPLSKTSIRILSKNKSGENFVERFEDTDFSYVLLPNINFPLSKHNRTLKIDPNSWSRQFCNCLKTAIVILRHALTWLLDINKQMNKQLCCKETSFIRSLFSVLIFIIYTEWVSIFGIHWVLISIIQKTQ